MTRRAGTEYVGNRARAGRWAASAWVVVAGLGATAAWAQTARMSLPLTEVDGGTRETRPVSSSDGSLVAFTSDLSNLVSGDTNLVDDVFVRDMASNAITRVSVATGSPGTQANGLSRWASMSADGRYVAFESQASNLVASDTNGYSDIFVRDRQTNTTTRVSVVTGGAQGTGGHSLRPSISANGRFVAFISAATNLVAGDTNTIYDVFVHDRNNGSTARVSVATDGTQQAAPLAPPQQGDWVVGATQPPAVSNDGRIVVFASWVSNLIATDTNASIDIFIRDRDTDADTVLDEVGAVSTVRINGAGAVQPDSKSLFPRITPDGRYIVFETYSISFVGGAGDPNVDIRDVMIHDRNSGTTTRLPSNTAAANAGSHHATISDNGQYVAFESLASDLTAGDTNSSSDIFLLDRNSSTVTRISRGPGAALANGHSSNPFISADGSSVVFESAATNLVAGDTNGLREPFRYSVAGSSQARVLVAADGSQITGAPRSLHTSTSGDGRYVVFASTSSSLVTGDTNDAEDVFLYDRVSALVTLVSVNGASQIGGSDPSISADGRFVAFTNGDVWVRDLLTSTTTKASNGLSGAATNGVSREPAISGDGRFVAFTSSATNLVGGDTNASDDIFVFDRQTSTTTRVSVATGGAQPTLPASQAHSRWPSISGNGRYVAFQSDASNLVASDTNVATDVFLHDRQTTTTTRVGVVTGAPGAQLAKGGSQPSLSADGRYVAFVSNSGELLSGAVNALTQVFVRDVQASLTTRISRLAAGEPDGGSDRPSISAHGRYVAFATSATNLFGGDTSAERDVVVADTTVPNTFTRVSGAVSGAPNGASDVPAISGDGLIVAFDSTAALVASDANRTLDTYVNARTVTADTDTAPGALTTQFKTQFGLVPGIDLPGDDPDGDGKTNAQEAAEGTHPRGYVLRYLAEGATSTFFSTRMAILNPGANSGIVLLRYQKSDGSTVPYVLNLAGRRRATVDVGTLSGLTAAEFATVVESDTLVVVDRTMKWDNNGYGSHAETAVNSPSLLWYFAEGATHSNFSLFYLLQNSNPTTAANVRVTYLLPSGAPIVRTYTVPAKSRSNIWVNQEPGLGATDVSATVEVTNGIPIVAERAMYLTRSGTPTFNAGHESAGVTALSTSWFFAEGATGNYFDLFLLMANPSASQTANVQARYLLDTGVVITKNYTVPPSSRFNIWVDFEDAQLANAAVSTTLTSTNGVPIIAERAMWWPNNGNEWFEAHNSAGATTTGTKWALAEGESGGASTTETYILVANTSGSAASVKVTLIFEDGTSSERTYPVPANSRFNVPVGSEFPSAAGKRYGAIVESLGGSPAPIVVERAMYSNGLGVVWAAGTNALGTKLQ